MFNSCSQAGLAKLIEIALAHRGTRDSTNYFGPKAPRTSTVTAEEEAEEEAGEELQAIEELITTVVPRTWVRWCGQSVLDNENPGNGKTKIKPHLNIYCPYLKAWLQNVLNFTTVGGRCV